MKITNSVLVGFINNAGNILDKKIPQKLFSAIDLNAAAAKDALATYGKQYEDIKNDEISEKEKNEKILELLDIELDLPLQTVSQDVFDRMEEGDKFDALTGREYQAIDFMVLK